MVHTAAVPAMATQCHMHAGVCTWRQCVSWWHLRMSHVSKRLYSSCSLCGRCSFVTVTAVSFAGLHGFGLSCAVTAFFQDVFISAASFRLARVHVSANHFRQVAHIWI